MRPMRAVGHNAPVCRFLFSALHILFACLYRFIGWLGSRVVSVLDSGAEGPGSNCSRDTVG